MPLYFGDRADRRGARGEGYSPAERQEWIRNAAIRSLGGEVDRSMLLVLEDLHWADQTTLEALCRLPEVGLSGPVLAVLISRPPLPGEATLAKLLDSVEHRIDLPPLSRENAHEFLEKLLGRHELPRAFLERVVDRAEGNPLFIEEMLKAILDSDAIQRDEDVWKATGDLASLDVPGTIESVLSTRIDGLDSASKSVLQYAAIVGRRFWGGVVSDALARRPVEKELGQLLEGAFVRALPFSTVTGDREFLFEHLLLQEVAYEGILRRLRSDLHGAVACLARGATRRAGRGVRRMDRLPLRAFDRAGTVAALSRASRRYRTRTRITQRRSLARTTRVEPREIGRIEGTPPRSHRGHRSRSR